MTVNVNVKLMGVFRVFSGKESVSLRLERPVVREAVEKIAEFLSAESKRMLIDPELNDPRPNALIFVNGKEISVLNELETKVEEGDQIVLIPISHGG
ncbi:MAG: MoaD/ThiS family protein [Candidatus Bathyarchaeia archaeon]